MNKHNQSSIFNIVHQGIREIPLPVLRNSLEEAYSSKMGTKVTRIGQELFQMLTSRSWPHETLARFLNGYQATHGTALYVSGLMIRVLRDAKKSTGEQREKLFLAAAELGEIIPEDTGVDDVPHGELFQSWANTILGDDSWKNSCYSVSACNEFREYIKTKRLHSTIAEGCLITAASENWNSAEYTLFDSLAPTWMIEKLEISAEQTRSCISYISNHAGETELRHFLHAISAWGLYCEAQQEALDPCAAKKVFCDYLEHLGSALTALSSVLTDCESNVMVA